MQRAAMDNAVSGSKARAAEVLGISLKTLYNRLAAYQAGESRVTTLQSANLPG